jgi:signal transduction histidine kinase
MSENAYDHKALDLLDYLGEGFQLISNDYKYLFVNASVVQQSKYSKKEDLIGFTMLEKYPGIDETPFFKILKECIETKCNKNMENEFNFPDGSKGYFELKIQGVPEGAIILSSDITERKKNDKEKEEHIDELEEMMFLTSHKVRQPVSHIMGFSYLLDRKMVNGTDLERVTDYLKASVTDLDNFTRELTETMHDLKMKVKQRNSLR